MSDQEMDASVDGRMARLEQQMQDLLEVVAAQAATIETYQRRTAGSVDARPSDAPAPGPSAEVADPVVLDRTLGRRRLLLGGATATAAAAAAVVAGSASPAAADNGGPLLLGQNNTANAETKLSYGANINNGFRVEGASDLAMIEGYQTGTGPGFKGMNTGFGAGVEGTSATGTGVLGQSGDIGVNGVSTNGSYGVKGESSGIGVLGVSTGTDSGVYGQSASIGVQGLGTGPGNGLWGYAIGTGTGLLGQSAAGIGAVLAGLRSNLHLVQRPGRVAPSADATAHEVGEVLVDGTGATWLCTVTGTPGTWRKIGGPATAGAFHVLPAPARIVDTRPGGVPTSVLPKTPLAAGSTRVYDLKVNGSGVPAGATAALITVLLVNAANGNGNMTLWANGVARPTANTMVWGAGAGRWTATAVSAVDSQARVQVNVSAKTDLVLDVVGYYR